MSTGDTYNDYLIRLPRRKAPEYVWESLQTSMFHLNAEDVPVHYPPAGLWQRIEGSQKKALLARRRLRLALATLLLLALAVPAYFIFSSSSKEPAQSQKENMGAVIDDPVQNQNRSEFPITVLPEIKSRLLGAMEEKAFLRHIPAKSGISFSKIEYRERSHLATLASIQSNFSIKNDPGSIQLLEPDDCSPFHSDFEFLYGLSYEEQFFNNEVSHMNSSLNNWQSLSLNAKFQFRSFYLQTGLGLTFSKDDIKWEYDYLRKEMVDSYIYVDSVYYDPETGETFYYTSIVEVYDSVKHTKALSTHKKHKYIHIPLMAGINLLEKRNFGMSMQAGLIYNVLLSGQSNLLLEPYEPDSRIMNVYYENTNRVEHNFNFVGRLNFEWKLNHKMSLYFYPSINYYLSPVYLNARGSGPFSFGLGAGIYFK